MVVTRPGQYTLADPNTARGAGETSLHNPLRSQLDWQSAMADTMERAGGDIRDKIESVIEFIKNTTGIDLHDPASLLAVLSNAIGIGDLAEILPKILGGFDGIDLDDPGGIIAYFLTHGLSLETLAQAVTGIAGGGTNPLDAITRYFTNSRSFFPFDFNDALFHPDTAAIEFINGVLKPKGVLDITSALPAWQLYGQLPAALLRFVPLTSIGLDSPNLLDDPQFQDADSINAFEGWSWDGTTGRTTLGCAKVTADGTLHELLSDPEIEVSTGQKLSFLIHAGWTGLVTTGGSPVRMTVEAYDAAHNWISSTELAAVGSGGGTSAPFSAALSGTYTVPAGVKYVRQQLVVTAQATAGDVRFDDGDVHKTQLLEEAFTLDLPDNLNNLFASAASGAANFADLLAALAGGSGGIADVINRFTHIGLDGKFDAAQLFNLANIGNIAVGKITGLAALLDALLPLSTWQLFLDSAKGASGGTIADIANKVRYLGLDGFFAADKLTGTVPKAIVEGLPALGGLVDDGFKSIFNGWNNTTTATGTATEVRDTMAQIRTAVAAGWNVAYFTSNNPNWIVPAGTRQMIGCVVNGGGKGANGTASNAASAPGGVGGSDGGYLSAELDMTGITPGTTALNITVGPPASVAGTDGGQSSIKLGATVLLAGAAGANGLGVDQGFVKTTSQPGKGGNGGTGRDSANSDAGQPGEDTGVALGGLGGPGSAAGAGTGNAGQAGGAGIANALPLCGGAGGGGGGGKGTGNVLQSVTGGPGGNGGHPGGGSGGGGGCVNSGGGTRNPGQSGTPGTGLVAILYK
ncbi:hypothetical protein [Mycobacterium aquaticum]|uniref:hypothetical protein n=1 Tax=Mycobacterium aquaticum TaxID=1927124 RepID=UPI0009F26F0F|nr:hypothetical protein [Mycobacterium aquaticum]